MLFYDSAWNFKRTSLHVHHDPFKNWIQKALPLGHILDNYGGK